MGGISDIELPHISDELLNDPNYSRLTLPIRDGTRTLSYSQCGNLRSDRIVLFHMGLMGSSLVNIMVHEQALSLNIRLIIIDYPGTGESTIVVHDDNTILESWAIDVEEFCNKVLPSSPDDAKEIMLLGHCLGVPHVLAVWARLGMTDHHRVVSKITLVSPWVGETKTNPWWMRNFVQRLPLQGYLPSVGAPLLTSTTYFNYPLSYLPMIGTDLQQALRSLHEIQYYNRLQGSAGNKEMIRLALMSSNKEKFWDPILKQIASNNNNAKNNKRDDHHDTTSIPTIKLFHGSSDAMVTEDACKLFIKWLEEEANCKVDFTVIEGGDHNTVLMDNNNMTKILEPFMDD